MKVHICGIDDMRQFHGQVTHVLSIIDPSNASYVLSLGVPPERRLVLYCHDVESEAEVTARGGDGHHCIAPSERLVKDALNFAKGLAKTDSLLVHCGYGISRSTAIAFAILCQAKPETPEDDVFRQVLEIRPQASPNLLIVKYADALLSRAGRMEKAMRGGARDE